MSYPTETLERSRAITYRFQTRDAYDEKAFKPRRVLDDPANSPFVRKGQDVGFGRAVRQKPKLPTEALAKRIPWGKIANRALRIAGSGAGLAVVEIVFDGYFTYDKPWDDFPGFTRTHGPYPSNGGPDALSQLAFPGPIGGQAIGQPNYPLNYVYPRADWGFFGLWDLQGYVGEGTLNPRYQNYERWQVTDIPLAVATQVEAQRLRVGVGTPIVRPSLDPEGDWMPREFPFDFPIGTAAGSRPTPRQFREKPNAQTQPRWRIGHATTIPMRASVGVLPSVQRTTLKPNSPPVTTIGGDHMLAPPRSPRLRERKIKVVAATRFLRAVGVGTEFKDAVEAIHSALPAEFQKPPRPKKYMTGDELRAFNRENDAAAKKAIDIFTNLDKVDVKKAIEELAKQNAADYAIGKSSAAAKKSLDQMVGSRPQLNAANPLGVVKQKSKAEWWASFNNRRKAQRQARRLSHQQGKK